MMEYGRIRLLRKEAGMSQAKLAEVLTAKAGKHYSKDAIGVYERGKTDVSTNVLVALAEIFGVNVDYLLSNTDNHKTYQVAEDNSQYSTATDDEFAGAMVSIMCRSKRLSPAEKQRLVAMIRVGWPELFARK
jgi:transcriptional regulator with XRE-family HTH domain